MRFTERESSSISKRPVLSYRIFFLLCAILSMLPQAVLASDAVQKKDKNDLMSSISGVTKVESIKNKTGGKYYTLELTDSKSIQSSLKMVDGAKFIDRMHKAPESCEDYQFKYSMKVFKGSRPIVEKGDFYFKRPGMIRLEETGSYKRGAVAILTESGRVKAHLGGKLSLFVVDLAPDSKMLRSANGHPMIESDFKSLSLALQSYVKKGMKTIVTADTLKVECIDRPVRILEIIEKDKSNTVWKRIAVDPDTLLPVQWWDFTDSGKLWSHATWYNIRTNLDLASDLFTIKGGKNVPAGSFRE